MKTDLLHTQNPSLDKLILLRKSDKLSTEVDDETVILDMDSGNYTGLNSVGTLIWKLLENAITFSELTQRLTDEYDIDKEICYAEILPFLNNLLNQKLISIK